MIPSDSMFTNSVLVKMEYESTSYECPFDQFVNDYNSVFKGCGHNLPTKEYPCTQYDSSLNKCLSCAYPWKANSAGRCIQEINCL